MPDRHVFIVTYGRSGSTLLQAVLNSLPGWCIRGENADAFGAFATAWANLADEPVVTRLERNQPRTPPDHPWYGGEALSAARMGATLARLFTDEVLRPPPGTRVAGFKEVRWGALPGGIARSLRFAEAFFPDSRFVFNTRDHAQVLRSAWWASRPEPEVRAMLADWEAQFDTEAALRPDRTIRLHYNDWSSHPEGLRPLIEWLGEDFDPATVAAILARPLTHGQRG
jgi:hypothetical protein